MSAASSPVPWHWGWPSCPRWPWPPCSVRSARPRAAPSGSRWSRRPPAPRGAAAAGRSWGGRPASPCGAETNRSGGEGEGTGVYKFTLRFLFFFWPFCFVCFVVVADFFLRIVLVGELLLFFLLSAKKLLTVNFSGVPINMHVNYDIILTFYWHPVFLYLQNVYNYVIFLSYTACTLTCMYKTWVLELMCLCWHLKVKAFEGRNQQDRVCTLVLDSMGAPLSSSISTTCSWPLRAPQCRGVRPSCGETGNSERSMLLWVLFHF